MKTTLILVLLALAGCATNLTPEQRAAQQDQAVRLMMLGTFMQQMAPPPPLVIHCLGCR